jgi:hypothetical protein
MFGVKTVKMASSQPIKPTRKKYIKETVNMNIQQTEISQFQSSKCKATSQDKFPFFTSWITRKNHVCFCGCNSCKLFSGHNRQRLRTMMLRGLRKYFDSLTFYFYALLFDFR